MLVRRNFLTLFAPAIITPGVLMKISAPKIIPFDFSDGDPFDMPIRPIEVDMTKEVSISLDRNNVRRLLATIDNAIERALQPLWGIENAIT